MVLRELTEYLLHLLIETNHHFYPQLPTFRTITHHCLALYMTSCHNADMITRVQNVMSLIEDCHYIQERRQNEPNKL